MTPSGSPRPPLLSRLTFMLSAGVLAVVAVCAIAMIVTDDGAGRLRPSATASPTHSPAVIFAAACPPTEADQTIPTTTPVGLTWRMFGPFAMPYSVAAGPLTLEGGLARCFARTPLGAALAAEHLSIRLQAGPDATRATALQAMPGPGRDAWIRNLGVNGVLDLTNPSGVTQLGGFRVVTFSSQQAVIDISPSEDQPGQVRVFTLTLAWEQGDWKLVIRPDGQLSPTPYSAASSDGAVPDIPGFVRWRTR